MRAAQTRFCALFLVVGCGGERPSPTPGDSGSSAVLPDPATVVLDGLCPPQADHGGFVVEVGETSSLSGRIRDGVLPSDQPEVLQHEGGCRLLQPARPFCDPPCATGEFCDLDESCRDYPSSLDLGEVVLEGPFGSMALPPLEPGFAYESSNLPHDPPWTDATLRLTTEDAALPALVLHGVGPPPLVGVSDTVSLLPEQPLSLQWEPAAGLGRASVVLTLSINVHGATPAWLACTLPDSGTATLSAALVDGLLSEGVSGFPTLTVSRESQDHTWASGTCADLVVRQRVERRPIVAGHTPCNDDGDCPEDQICDLMTESCI